MLTRLRVIMKTLLILAFTKGYYMKIVGSILILVGVVLILLGIGAPMVRVATQENMHMNFMVGSAIGVITGAILLVIGLLLMKHNRKILNK